MQKSLPIGVESFRELRENDYYYVDKTALILRLIDGCKYYFFARPRGFGTSVLLDTIQCLYEGRRELFTGLYAEQHWDWSKTNPVLRFRFGDRPFATPEDLENSLAEQLAAFEQAFDMPPSDSDAPDRLMSLLRKLHDRHGRRVVVLVDAYDKPILDTLPEPAVAKNMQHRLLNFLSVLKDGDAHLHFVMVTGVGRFLRGGIFSGLNHLDDITLNQRYSALCGFREEEMDTVFASELAGLDREEIRREYLGYSWEGDAVYSPIDLLQLFHTRAFRPAWFETSVPAFVFEFLKQHPFFTPDFTPFAASPSLLTSFDVDNLEPTSVLWYTGLLALHEVEEPVTGIWDYTVGYPNRAV